MRKVSVFRAGSIVIWARFAKSILIGEGRTAPLPCPTLLENQKLEIRNPKYETNSKFEIRRFETGDVVEVEGQGDASGAGTVGIASKRSLGDGGACMSGEYGPPAVVAGYASHADGLFLLSMLACLVNMVVGQTDC